MSAENRAELRKPLQAILISPDKKERQMILSGEKTVSVRYGHRDYEIGPVMLCCHIEPWTVKAEITNVKHITVSQVPSEDALASGMKSGSLSEILLDLRKYYPSITFSSPVTVVRWNNLEGKLAEKAKKSKRAGYVQ